MKWLKGLADREEVRGARVREEVRVACTDAVVSFQSTVNMVQVVDFLTGKGVSKEEAMEVRTEGRGCATGWHDQFSSTVL